jgi:hypothetical protein
MDLSRVTLTCSRVPDALRLSERRLEVRVLERVRGSHEVWCHKNKTFVLATHGNDLKPYQIKEARKHLKEV